MVTTRAVDGAAIGHGAQELEAGSGTPLGQLATVPVAAGITQQPPASAAQPYKVMPRSAAWAPRAAAFSLSAGGYAGASAKATTAKSPSAKSTTMKSTTTKSTSAKTASAKTTSTKTAATNELAFLDDPTLSIQDKLYQFMALQMKKSNRELKEALQEYQGKRAQSVAQQKETAKTGTTGSSGTSSGGSVPAKKSSGGGGLFGMLGDALGGIADAVVGGAESLAKDLGGPLLAAGCTAVGLPFLAPLALQIGGTIGKAAVGGVASLIGDTASSLWGGASLGNAEAPRGAGVATSGTAATGSTSTSGGTSTSSASAALKASTTKASTTKASTTTTKAAVSDSDDFDERVEAMNLQRLVEKQQAMFAILSNALKAMHDTQMNAIQNMR